MNDLITQKSKLLGSFLLFVQVFYKLRTGRDFVISQPTGRESHFVTIARAFTKVLRGETTSLLINVAPGTGKSELCKHFVAWALAHYPDSNFIYVSYGHELASKHTEGIRDILCIPTYKRLFGVHLDSNSCAKDNFRTLQGGVVYAAGSAGTITGQDAGLPITNRFSGGLIIDDIHKPDEVHSDTIRERVKKNYDETILPRLRSPTVPIISIGQRLQEDDLPANILKGVDGRKWEKVILKSLDDAQNALYPEVHTKAFLLNLQDKSPYVFSSQHQQDPLPAGGGIFKSSWFALKDAEPKMVMTFITADTAETDQNWNDPTVFSFWGVYKINQFGADTNLYGLHWIDCYEEWLEPKDLEREFLDFVGECMRYPTKPMHAAIEKKSTGVTLLSTLKGIQGLTVLGVERTKASKSKTARYYDIQTFVASGLISLPKNAQHTESSLEHMRKITGNNTHRHDDRADTLYDAIKIALIDKTIIHIGAKDDATEELVKSMAHTFNKRKVARSRTSWHNR